MTLYVVGRCPPGEWVEVPLEVIDAAIQRGIRMWKKSHMDGRRDRDDWRGFEGEGGKRGQCLGAICEAIAAWAFGIPWEENIDTFSDPDLPHNIEVRLIGMEHYGLRVYPRNDDSRRVVGVVIPRGQERAGRYRIAGWTLAGDAKRPEWQMAPHGRPPMFAIPQPLLRSVLSLRNHIAWEQANL